MNNGDNRPTLDDRIENVNPDDVIDNIMSLITEAWKVKGQANILKDEIEELRRNNYTMGVFATNISGFLGVLNHYFITEGRGEKTDKLKDILGDAWRKLPESTRKSNFAIAKRFNLE